MPLRVRDIRVVFMVRFQRVLLSLACRRGDGPELRADRCVWQPRLLTTSKQMEGERDIIYH